MTYFKKILLSILLVVLTGVGGHFVYSADVPLGAGIDNIARNYWQRSGGTISPLTANDDVNIGSGSYYGDGSQLTGINISGTTTPSLDDLTDVTITSATLNDVLKYNGANWVNGTISGSGDVVGNTTSADNAVVRYEGTTGKSIQNSLVTITDAGGLTAVVLNASSSILPTISDGAALGNGSLMFSDLFLASGGVINFNNGDITITHSTDAITFNGGNLLFGGGTAASEFRFLEPSGSGSNYTAFKSQAQAGDITYTLPASDGTYGQGLSTDATGGLSWKTVAAGGAVTVPKNRALPYEQIEEMDSGWSDWYSVGTISHDSSVYKSGSASVKIVAANNNANTGARKNITDGDWSKSSFKFWVRSTDWTQVTNAEVLVSTSGTFSAFWYLNLMDFLVSPPNDEWIEIVATRSDFSVGSGSPNWATANDVILRVKATNTLTPTVWFDGFARYTAPNKGMVSIVFDDAEESQYTQGKLKMDAYNFPGTAYVIYNVIGDSGKLTQAQIDGLASAGWDISGHGDTNLTGLTTAQRESDLSQMKNYLRTYGYKGMDNYALPNGDYNDATLAQVYKYFGTARNIDGLKQTTNYIPRRINSVSISQATSTATIQGYVDDAIANGDWLVLTFHSIVTTPGSDTEYSIANFGTVIDYINTSGIQVATVSDAIEALPTTSSKDTLTNKRITQRVVTATDATSITPNSDNADTTYQLNTQSAGTLTINADAGTPTNAQKWVLKVKSSNVQTLAFNTGVDGYVSGSGSSAVTLPTATSGGGKVDMFGFIYDSILSKWLIVAKAMGYQN